MRAGFKQALAVLTAVSGALVLGSAHDSVVPGSPAQIAADVASSLSLAKLPATTNPPLDRAANDTASSLTPKLSNCLALGTDLNPSSCVFGDTTGSHTMVLWGDSHAYMWFPALNAIAKSAHWKLIALMDYGCPVADISVWNAITKSPYTTCNTFRSNVIKHINALRPSLVVMAEQFQLAAAGSNGTPGTITPAKWQTALEKTLAQLHGIKKKVVIGDTVLGTGASAMPVQCLVSSPSAVQQCTSTDTTAQQAQRQAELAASQARSTTYVNVLPWLCAQSVNPMQCSALISDPKNHALVVYYSAGHITATYALFLTNVLRSALNPL